MREAGAAAWAKMLTALPEHGRAACRASLSLVIGDRPELVLGAQARVRVCVCVNKFKKCGREMAQLLGMDIVLTENWS